jgi:hypothetical protein
MNKSFLPSTPLKHYYFPSHLTHLQIPATLHATSSSFPLHHSRDRLPLNRPRQIISFTPTPAEHLIPMLVMSHLNSHGRTSSPPHHLLSGTNNIWSANHPDNKFVTTYHTATPSQWALHNNLLFTYYLLMPYTYLQLSQQSSPIINIMQHALYHQPSYPHTFLMHTYPLIFASKL